MSGKDRAVCHHVLVSQAYAAADVQFVAIMTDVSLIAVVYTPIEPCQRVFSGVFEAAVHFFIILWGTCGCLPAEAVHLP